MRWLWQHGSASASERVVAMESGVPAMMRLLPAAGLLTAAAARGEQAAGITGAADGIAETVAEPMRRNAALPHLLPPEWSRPVRTAAAEHLGLSFALTHASLAIGKQGGGDADGAASGESALSLRWHLPVFRQPDGPVLAARVRMRQRWSDAAPSTMGSADGLLWRLVDGFTDRGWELPEFYVEDRLPWKGWLLRLGQMAPDDLLDDHPLRSARRSFLNQAFSSSPAVGFPGTGGGAALRWEGDGGWDVTATASNMQSSNIGDDGRWRLGATELFQGLQFGRDIGTDARLQILLWRTDGLASEGTGADRGVSLTVSRDGGGGTSGFARLAFAEGGTAAVRVFGAAGISRPAGRAGQWGLALAAGRAAVGDDDWQGAAEGFWRQRLAADCFLTGFAQAMVGDGVTRGWVAAGGVRLTLEF